MQYPLIKGLNWEVTVSHCLLTLRLYTYRIG